MMLFVVCMPLMQRHVSRAENGWLQSLEPPWIFTFGDELEGKDDRGVSNALLDSTSFGHGVRIPVVRIHLLNWRHSVLSWATG